jgi:hypothetical protein
MPHCFCDELALSVGLYPANRESADEGKAQLGER